MTDAQREELVDLFNKGTHFEGMLAELRAARIIVDKWCHTQGNARAFVGCPCSAIGRQDRQGGGGRE